MMIHTLSLPEIKSSHLPVIIFTTLSLKFFFTNLFFCHRRHDRKTLCFGKLNPSLLVGKFDINFLRLNLMWTFQLHFCIFHSNYLWATSSLLYQTYKFICHSKSKSKFRKSKPTKVSQLRK